MIPRTEAQAPVHGTIVCLAAMRDAVARYEAEFGAISEREIATQARDNRRAAVMVRRSAGKPPATRVTARKSRCVA